MLFGRTIYLLSGRSECSLPCVQAGTGNRFGEKSSTLFSQQCLTEAFILLSPAKLSVQFLQTERLLLSPGSPAGEPEQTPGPAAGCPLKCPQLYTWLLQSSDSNFSFG